MDQQFHSLTKNYEMLEGLVRDLHPLTKRSEATKVLVMFWWDWTQIFPKDWQAREKEEGVILTGKAKWCQWWIIICLQCDKMCGIINNENLRFSTSRIMALETCIQGKIVWRAWGNWSPRNQFEVKFGLDQSFGSTPWAQVFSEGNNLTLPQMPVSKATILAGQEHLLQYFIPSKISKLHGKTQDRQKKNEKTDEKLILGPNPGFPNGLLAHTQT